MVLFVLFVLIHVKPYSLPIPKKCKKSVKLNFHTEKSNTASLYVKSQGIKM